MTKERDPRVEPKENDTLQKLRRCNGKLLSRRVTYNRGRNTTRKRNIVRFLETFDGWSQYKGCSLKDWQTWAKDATVTRRGGGL